MADDPIDDPAADRDVLSTQWVFEADSAAHKLGVADPLRTMSSERWQRVLASVEARMKMRGVSLPNNWQRSLTRQVGRHDE